MKFLLSVILWAMMPMLTPQGLQIGVVNINNKTIRLMKKCILSPEWLQGAGNVGGVGEYITVSTQDGDLFIYELSAIGEVTIKSVYQGESKTIVLTNPQNEYVSNIQADPNTIVSIYGTITKLDFGEQLPGFSLSEIDLTHAISLTYLCVNGRELTSIDVSKNTELLYLDVSQNPLTELDVSKNTKLTSLKCYETQLSSLDTSKNTELTELYASSTNLTGFDASQNNKLQILNVSSCLEIRNIDFQDCTQLESIVLGGSYKLLSISGIAINEDVAISIAYAITNANSVDGTVTLRQGDEFNQTIIDAAMDKGWDVQYYS